MKRDHTKLICDIGEMSGLFIDTTSLETFLQKIVDMISEHMNSEVCSIYLYYEDTNELILKATKGLNPNSIGQVRMKLGEGLTGLALKELRAICERNASKNPHFKSFPGIGEEKFESFLAVPILRGQNRIGVMVIQNTKRNSFEDDDVKVFKAVTSQLANTIETAKLLMGLNEKNQLTKPLVEKKEDLKFIKGRVGSPGWAYSEAVVMEMDPLKMVSSVDKYRAFTLKDFTLAVQLSEKQLEILQHEIEERLSDVASLIFAAQILMLKDKGFIEPMIEQINRGINPPAAVINVVADYVRRFRQMSDPYIREKDHDVRDIGNRLLSNLFGPIQNQNDLNGKILIAEELFPSDALKLSSQKIAGIILLSGGVSSHLSILARSLGLPLIIADHPGLLRIPKDTKILIDGEQGNLYVNPTGQVVATFKEKEELRLKSESLKGSLGKETKTKDGTAITLLCNINLLGDVKAARDFNAQGIGLYRTEFPFIVRSDFPTEEEQYFIYKKLVDSMPGCEITFRTLDIGGDKILSYYHHGKEENPFLGMRSIRFSLRHKDIFTQQLRAILRAGFQADLKIMFPMISSLDDFLEAKEVVSEAIAALTSEKIPCHRDPKIGIMVELPSVIEIIDDLAQEADFFSIGTNDFIQYMLGVDRTNEKVADFYLPYHPSILRSLKKVVDSAHRFQKEVSICGDMAQEEKYLFYFLGIGITRISVDARFIPKIHHLIAKMDLQLAKKEVQNILSKNKVRDIAAIVGQSRKE